MVGKVQLEVITSENSEFFFEEQRRLEQDAASQRLFIEFVSGLRKHNVAELPDTGSLLNHEGKTTAKLNECYEQGSAVAYISPDIFGSKEHSSLPDRAAFTTNDVLRLGRDNSRQQVFFGTLHSESFKSGEKRLGQIAVKPISSRGFNRERMLHEVAMYQHMSELGIPTLDVKGVAIFNQPLDGLSGFVVTEFDPELTTLDTLKWADTEVLERVQYVLPALDTLALLHSNLLFHGDAEFKNIGVRTAKGSIAVVDVEYGSSLKERPEDIDIISKRMSHDLTSLSTSVDEYIIGAKCGVYAPMSDIERFEFLYKNIFEPYYIRLVQACGPHTGVLARSFQIVMEQKFRQSHGEW